MYYCSRHVICSNNEILLKGGIFNYWPATNIFPLNIHEIIIEYGITNSSFQVTYKQYHSCYSSVQLQFRRWCVAQWTYYTPIKRCNRNKLNEGCVVLAIKIFIKLQRCILTTFLWPETLITFTMKYISFSVCYPIYLH